MKVKIKLSNENKQLPQPKHFGNLNVWFKIKTKLLKQMMVKWKLKLKKKIY